MQDKTEITDADTAMAAEYSRRFPDLRLPEAFARHREQATASLREERDALREGLEYALCELDRTERRHSKSTELARAALSSVLGEG